ncbi:hypothetical protein LCGC14_0793220 [marine sediment metagenome]|uniref:Alkyl hydroperoxide reductase subunit C/ Thiol specific antioxidant domain-containing protein n=1 Tax=marine sediment metagenome TaxID=412755 RepID=A0A0F9QBS8_9ZZZZ|nr:hypothetical protein [Candidatus Aminicenantes bacterium]HEB34850.1 hypothetical protein [Candidatus Aminicenantes bacterium]
MILRKKVIIIIITILTVLFFITDSNSNEQDRNPILDKKFFLIIDMDFINCSLCLQSFTKFIETINANELEKSVLGILIFHEDEDELSSEIDIQIIEKQLRGFILGNNIKFPIILDKNGVFSDLDLDLSVTALILFDVQKKVIKKYKFPLTKEQLNEISREKEKIDNS